MPETNKIFEIVDLILKSIRGELSEQEKITLNQWISSSAENEKLYDRLRSKRNLSRKAKEYALIDIEKERRLFIQKYDRPNKAFFRFKRAIRFAASVAAISAISVVLYFTLTEKTQTGEISLVVPGSKKASLTLTDGSIIHLSELKKDSVIKENGLLIRKEGAKISYVSHDPDANTHPGNIFSKKPVKPPYHTLYIPRGGEYFVVLPDGTKVWINSETCLKYPVFFEKKKERKVYIAGEAYFEVARDTSRPFIVKLDKRGEIKVLGTHFNVKAYKDERAVRTTLVEGKISFTTEKSGKEIILNPGQQAIAPNSGAVKVIEVNVEEYTGWKDGLHIFVNRRLEDIMNDLERWYDVNVTFDEPSLKNLMFSGNLKRYEDITKFLKVLKATGDVNYEIKEKEIIITR